MYLSAVLRRYQWDAGVLHGNQASAAKLFGIPELPYPIGLEMRMQDQADHELLHYRVTS